jgi:hypothetical protein
VEAALNQVALAIQNSVEAPSVFSALRSVWNHWFDVTTSKGVDDFVRVVGGVRQADATGQEVQEILCDRRFVVLARCEFDMKRTALEVRDEVNLGGEASP